VASMIYTPEDEIQNRIKRFQKKLKNTELDCAIIMHHTNLFYFSGTSQNGHLFIPSEGEPVLLIKKSYKRACLESQIKNIMEVKSIKKIPSILKSQGFGNLGKIGLELDVVPYNTNSFYMKIFAESKLSDISKIVNKVRLIKSKYEIDLLKYSAHVIDEVFKMVPSMLREGMMEIELAALFESEMRKRGYGGYSQMRAFNQDFFMGTLTSGTNGAAPTYFDGPVGGMGVTPANNPHGAGWKRIRRNEVVYIDYTCVVNGYTADTTRMFVIGEISERLNDAYKKSLKILNEVIKNVKPGVSCESLYEKAATMVKNWGLTDKFMGMGQDRVRFIGHGVGLELDEMPVFATGLKMDLAEGMTFAMEPKFVFEEGAVGIENTYAVTEDGSECLNHAPMEIIQV